MADGRADMNVKTINHKAALHLAAVHVAASKDHEHAVRLLLADARVDVYAEGKGRWTVLHAAAN